MLKDFVILFAFQKFIILLLHISSNYDLLLSSWIWLKIFNFVVRMYRFWLHIFFFFPCYNIFTVILHLKIIIDKVRKWFWILRYLILILLLNFFVFRCNIPTLEEMQESIKDNPSVNLKDLQKALSYDKNVSYDKNEVS